MSAKQETAIDKQVGGDHYKNCKIQPVEYIESNGLGFLMGNVVKYVTRYAVKSNVQDLEKPSTTLNFNYN